MITPISPPNAVNNALDYLRKLIDQHGKEVYQADPTLAGDLALAEAAHTQLRTLGVDKIARIKEIVEAPDRHSINSEAALPGAICVDISAKTYNRDKITQAFKILSTYQTLMKWQEKVDEHRKVIALEALL